VIGSVQSQEIGVLNDKAVVDAIGQLEIAACENWNMQIERFSRFVCWFSLSLCLPKTPLASTSIVPGPSSTNPISTGPPASNLKALGEVSDSLLGLRVDCLKSPHSCAGSNPGGVPSGDVDSSQCSSGLLRKVVNPESCYQRVVSRDNRSHSGIRTDTT
jgi:hypothetical protein